MKESEVKTQMDRITLYRRIEAKRNEIAAALKKVTEDWETGPCGQGPFTGNTRESRHVLAMHIRFSATRGGAPPVDIEILNMHIEAWDVGRALEQMLRAKIKVLNDEMEEI